MNVKLDKMTTETLQEKLLSGEVDINELDLHKSAHREAFVSVIRRSCEKFR